MEIIQGELETRLMIFSKAFQDLLREIMKERQLQERLRKEIEDLRKEIKELKEKKSTKKTQ